MISYHHEQQKWFQNKKKKNAYTNIDNINVWYYFVFQMNFLLFFHGFLGYNGEKNSQILSFQKVKHQGKSRNFICEKICVCVEIQYSRRYVFSLFEWKLCEKNLSFGWRFFFGWYSKKVSLSVFILQLLLFIEHSFSYPKIMLFFRLSFWFVFILLNSVLFCEMRILFRL